jgi:hypothetical protein
MLNRHHRVTTASPLRHHSAARPAGAKDVQAAGGRGIRRDVFFR